MKPELRSQVETRLREYAPTVKIMHRWSGQVLETRDGLPYIGEVTPGRFVATGFAGNGMTFGTLAAMMATDAVSGRTNPWQSLFDARRTQLLTGALSAVSVGRRRGQRPGGSQQEGQSVI